MSLWTKRHRIPVTGFCSEAASTIFEGKIWTVCDASDKEVEPCRTRIFVFDPETEVFTEKNCVVPEIWLANLQYLAADDKNLYLWRRSAQDGREHDFHLFKLNRATMEWETVLNIRRGGYFDSILIINQIMHILEIDTYTANLIRIDLQKSEVVDIKLLSTGEHGRLFFHNNVLFLSMYGRVEKVYVNENGETKEVARKEHPNGSVRVFDENVSVFYWHHGEQFVFKAHNFDFNTLKWESEVNNPDWPAFRRSELYMYSESCVKINGSIYVLIRYLLKRGFELRQLDLHPKLTSICLADLSKRLFKKEDAQKLKEVKQQLPIHLRTQLENLLIWKSGMR